MKTVKRILIGIVIGGIMNGLLWGGFSAISLALQEEGKKDLQNGWVLFIFLSFGLFGVLFGAVVGFFVSFINAGKIISAIGGAFAAFFTILFVMLFNGPIDKNSTVKDLTFMPFVFSLFSASVCYLIVSALDRWQVNKLN